MSGKTAAIIGATGMIGQNLQELLLQDASFDTVRILVRRPVERTAPGLEIKLVDFSDYESVRLALEGVDVIFCAIGTTQKKVKGNKDLYRRIDLDIPLKVARIGRENGCERFIVITSVGANSRSRNFYLQLKGELEERLQATGLQYLHIMQPSMLLGHRSEHRPGEGFLQKTTQLLSGLLAGSWKKYRAIQGHTVAKAMVKAASIETPGIFRYTYEDIKKLAGE